MIAVYPGSFDPITIGHYDIISRSARLYDRVIVVVAVNAAKMPVFTLPERLSMLERACELLPNVSIEPLPAGLLVEFAANRGAQVIVKGLRAVSDFEYEFQMAHINRRLHPEIETVFLMASAEHSFLSSSIVKEIARLGGDFSGLVPDGILPSMRAKFATDSRSPAGTSLLSAADASGEGGSLSEAGMWDASAAGPDSGPGFGREA